jgi:hypothetical protein
MTPQQTQRFGQLSRDRPSNYGADYRAHPGGESHSEGPPKCDPNDWRHDCAPPVLAPRNPKTARKISDPAETIRIRRLDGDASTSASGAAAPAENVAAEVSAAWIGLAAVISDMPSSSRACAPSAHPYNVDRYMPGAQAAACREPVSLMMSTSVLMASGGLS